MNYCNVNWIFNTCLNIGDYRAYPIDGKIMLEFYHSGEIVKSTQLEF